MVGQPVDEGDSARRIGKDGWGQLLLRLDRRIERRQTDDNGDGGEKTCVPTVIDDACWIEPQEDSAAVDGTIDLAASISHVVIRPEDREEGVVQPLTFETEPVEFSNLFGAQFTSTRALATFPAEAAPVASEDRDLEVVVITPAGERKCNVDNVDIRRMFQMDR